MYVYIIYMDMLCIMIAYESADTGYLFLSCKSAVHSASWSALLRFPLCSLICLDLANRRHSRRAGLCRSSWFPGPSMCLAVGVLSYLASLWFFLSPSLLQVWSASNSFQGLLLIGPLNVTTPLQMLLSLNIPQLHFE